jgi:hypothetical protein
MINTEIVKAATKDCQQADCAVTVRATGSTMLGSTPQYDRNGNRTNKGNPNSVTHDVHCQRCDRSWTAHTQYEKLVEVRPT